MSFSKEEQQEEVEMEEESLCAIYKRILLLYGRREGGYGGVGD